MKVYCRDCKHWGNYFDECDHPDNFIWIDYYDKPRKQFKWNTWDKNEGNDCEYYEAKPPKKPNRILAYLRALFN